jgi:ribose transport system substrate-binding protein
MKKLKRLAAAACAAMTLLSLAACSTTPPKTDGAGGSSQTNDNSNVKVTSILISSASQVTTAQGNAIQAYAESKGASCTLEYYDQNIQTEASMIENAITAETNIMIVQNQSEGDCVAEIQKAHDAGIIVILYGVDVPDADYTYYYAEDAHALGKEMGETAGKWANENLIANGKSVVAVLGNYSVSPLAVDRYEGIKEGLENVCKDAKIVGTYDMAYKEEGVTAGENILQAHPDVNLVVGINDQSTCGVYEVFNAAGLGDKDIGMFGLDGTAEAEYLIAQDTMFKATINIDPNRVGEQMVQAGLDKLSGSSDAPTDKVIYWDGTLVTKDNINDFKDQWGSLAK